MCYLILCLIEQAKLKAPKQPIWLKSMNILQFKAPEVRYEEGMSLECQSLA